MERKAYRFPTGMLAEVAADARRLGITEAVWARDAFARQLGRNTGRDEIAELARRNDQRFAELEEKLAVMKERVDGISRRMRG
jgi:ABC-type Fe2+-enterobactin transport system substrate-binding protein